MAPPVIEHPEIRPFLPMLWVAWADGHLSETELEELRQSVDRTPWLSRSAREELARWLDPSNPPGAQDLASILETIRAASGTLSTSRRYSLAELGRAMAIAEGAEGAEEDVADALSRMSEALGLSSRALGAPMIRPQPGRPRLPAPRFDADALQRHLDGARHAVRDRVRRFLAEPAHRPEPELDMDTYRHTVRDWLEELAERDFGALAYPGVTGDAEDLGDFMVSFETLGYGDLSLVVKYGVQFGLFGGSIYFLGTEEQRHRFLPDIATLDLPGCFAMTELGHGSNVMELETTATYDPARDEIIVHTPRESARKEWIGNAALHGRMATVFAQLRVDGAEHGVHAVLVPIRDPEGRALPGVRIGDSGHKLGLQGVDNGRLWFDQVRVPRDHLLGRFGAITEEGHYESSIASPSKRFFTMLGTLVAGRISVATAALSASKVGLAIAVRYGSMRRQFGPDGGEEIPILGYRTHQRRLLPKLATAYALHFALDHARRRFTEAEGDARREVESLAAGLKAYATRHATDTLQACRELCGGQGYASRNRIGPLKSDTDVFTTFEGDNTVLLQLVAKGLLTGLQRELADDRVLGLVRYLARRAGATLAEKHPVITRTTDSDHLRDPGFLERVLRYREDSLLSSAARRFRSRIRDDTDAFAAVVDIQDHLIALANAHVERVILERFGAAIAELEDPEPPGAQTLDADIAAALGRLRDLFGLSRIESDLAWFLENGLMEPSKSRAVRKEINRLCSEVSDDAIGLVNAFGIPDSCLAAPIAFGDPAAE